MFQELTATAVNSIEHTSTTITTVTSGWGGVAAYNVTSSGEDPQTHFHLL